MLHGPATPIDCVAADLVQPLFEGKFFRAFCVLFGWGIRVQMQSSAGEEREFAPRYPRHLAGQAQVRVMHAVFAFTGDILVRYAILGMLPKRVRDAPARCLIRLALR